MLFELAYNVSYMPRINNRISFHDVISMISGDNIIDYFLLLMDENLGVWNNNGDKDGVRFTTLRASDTLDGDRDQFSAQPDMPGIFAIVNKTG